MSTKRSILTALSLVILLPALSVSSQAASLWLKTSEREFQVSTFQTPARSPRSVVIVLSGAKGYGARAYSSLQRSLNAAGIDVFMVHFISHDDNRAMEAAASAPGRVAYYGKRMTEWRETIQRVVGAIAANPQYRGAKIGMLGVSLGAMPVLAESANNRLIDATVAVDGGFPATFRTKVRSLPPLLAVWGSEDRVFSLSTGAALRDLARSLGGDGELLAYKGEGHAFFLEDDNANAELARAKIVQFFAKYLNITE